MKVRKRHCDKVCGTALLALTCVVSMSCSAVTAAPLPAAVAMAKQRMVQSAGAPVYFKGDGHLTYVSTRAQAPIRLSGVPVTATVQERARKFVAAYGKAFGMDDEQSVAIVQASGQRDAAGMEHVRLQQLYHGVPVTGAEMNLHLRGSSVVSVLAKTLPISGSPEIRPAIDAAVASAYVMDILQKRDLAPMQVRLSVPHLELFNRGLLTGGQSGTRLTWFVEAQGPHVHEYVWMDARTGALVAHFDQSAHLLSRSVHTANKSPRLPGRLLRMNGAPRTGDRDADLAYLFAGDTYNFYLKRLGRDSFDGLGSPILSTVHYCPSLLDCPYANAQWDSVRKQMVYGEGYASADDVVAHELTHGVIQHSARLFYSFQAGALNESYADIFGESVDLTNRHGTDNPEVRWQIGEDLPVGAIRNLARPELFGDPGKVTDPNYRCLKLSDDNAAVHTDSSVPNHAYALMVDGGDYNGVRVQGIGLNKAMKIQYRALTEYLPKSANLIDNYRALRRACRDLIGTNGITRRTCRQVKAALDAVEMQALVCTVKRIPPLCNAGATPVDLFRDNFESSENSAFVTDDATVWTIGEQEFAREGSMYLDATPPALGGAATYSAQMANDVAIPTGDTRMQFSHLYEFEDGQRNGAYSAFDGGVVEYSTNKGVTWKDAGPLMTAGQGYDGTLSECCDNPLSGRRAFTGGAFGFTGTQSSLASLAGKNVRFRFRLAVDTAVASTGWAIDEVRIYRCVSGP